MRLRSGLVWGWLAFAAMGADDSFITQYEYGQMLYENPRGIGCSQCHGPHGEGALIAQYVDGNQTVKLYGPDIRKITKAWLKKSLEKRHRIMPTYFLTDMEITALYGYLTHKAE